MLNWDDRPIEVGEVSDVKAIRTFFVSPARLVFRFFVVDCVYLLSLFKGVRQVVGTYVWSLLFNSALYAVVLLISRHLALTTSSL